MKATPIMLQLVFLQVFLYGNKSCLNGLLVHIMEHCLRQRSIRIHFQSPLKAGSGDAPTALQLSSPEAFSYKGATAGN